MGKSCLLLEVGTYVVRYPPSEVAGVNAAKMLTEVLGTMMKLMLMEFEMLVKFLLEMLMVMRVKMLVKVLE